MSATKDGTLKFDAYNGDPLARLALQKMGKSWGLPTAYAGASVVFVGLAMLVYMIRDGAIDVGKFGGYHTLIPTLACNLVVYFLGGYFYVYFALKSGTLYQDLADKGVIDQSDKALQATVKSIERVHGYVLWPLIALVMALILLMTTLYSWWWGLDKWHPDILEQIRYGSTYVFIILPVWIVGMYMVGMICTRFLVTIWGLRKVFKITPVLVQPLHPDKCGGLKPLLNYALAISYILAMFGLGLTLWGYGVTQVWKEGVVTTQTNMLLKFPGLWFGVAIYVVMAPVSFFGTLGTAHGPMKEVKSKNLEDLSTVFNENYKELHKAFNGETAKIDDRIGRLKQIHEIYRMTEAFPVWPMDMGTLRWFGTVVSSPLVGAGIAIPLQLYVL